MYEWVEILSNSTKQARYVIISLQERVRRVQVKYHTNSINCLFNFLQNVRQILVVSRYPPLLDTTLLIYRFGVSLFIILVTIPLLE